jgi:hypothetical protein
MEPFTLLSEDESQKMKRCCHDCQLVILTLRPRNVQRTSCRGDARDLLHLQSLGGEETALIG